MTDTPTPDQDDTTQKNPRSGYLPVLPDGCRWSVAAVDDDGNSVASITADHVVTFSTPLGYRRVQAETLSDATKIVAAGLRAVAKAEAEERAAAVAREEAFEALGAPPVQEAVVEGRAVVDTRATLPADLVTP